MSMPESARKTLREGFFPQMSTEGLTALAEALRTDDGRLLQGATTTPPPLHSIQNRPVEAGCLIAYPAVIDNGGWGVATVAAVEVKFAEVCFECDNRLGEPAACRHLLSWYDETPREKMRRELLNEVQHELTIRSENRTAT